MYCTLVRNFALSWDEYLTIKPKQIQQKNNQIRILVILTLV